MEEMLKSAAGYIPNFLFTGAIIWAGKIWVSSVNQSIKGLVESVHGMEVYFAEFKGMSATQIAEIKKDVKANEASCTLSNNKADMLHRRLDSFKKQTT